MARPGPTHKSTPPATAEATPADTTELESSDVVAPAPVTDWTAKVQLQGPHRAGFVGLLGRPNVGKSTLLNHLLGIKLAAASPRPQTTRRRFKGFLTLPGVQLVLVDTPGLFDGALIPDGGKGGFGELGSFMAKETRSALGDVEAVVWVEEATPGEELTAVQKALAEMLKASHKPVVLALNKVDRIKKTDVLAVLQQWKDLMPFKALVPLSALRQDGLERLVTELAALVPEGPVLFPEGDLTDASERAVCEELIREKVMMRTGEEVPYAVAVEIQQFDESRRAGNGKKPGIVDIEATIHVERDGQKAIVVGKGGAKIKEVGTLARVELERFLGCKVMLRLFVKVSDSWSRSSRGLRNLGYR